VIVEYYEGISGKEFLTLMVNYHPRKLTGSWTAGYVLDLHTISSVLIGYDEYGQAQFDTTYSEVGSLLNRLKYRHDKSALPRLVETAVSFLRLWDIDFSVVVPVPSTRIYRTFQPVVILATEIASTFAVPILNTALRKTKQTPELKNIYDAEQRHRLLSGALQAAERLRRQKILLVDDLYRSGATMNAAAQVVLAAAASEVYAFALTQTRTKR